MNRHRSSAAWAAAILAVGVGFMAHESAHAVAGWLAGGKPSLITATETRGDFTALTPGGRMLLGASGSLANLLLAGLGLIGMRRSIQDPDLRLTAWFVTSLNLMLVSTKAVAESLLGWGDWMSILQPVGAPVWLRITVAIGGTAGIIALVRWSGRRLGDLIPAGEPRERVREARRLLLHAAGATAILVVGASLADPVATGRALLLALVGGVAQFLPLLIGARLVAVSPGGDIQPARGSRLWLAAAACVCLLMWLGFGPGIDLTGRLR